MVSMLPESVFVKYVSLLEDQQLLSGMFEQLVELPPISS